MDVGSEEGAIYVTCNYCVVLRMVVLSPIQLQVYL